MRTLALTADYFILIKHGAEIIALVLFPDNTEALRLL